MSTTDNLKAAFAGESQANRKYLAYAKKAEAEGYQQVAKLFRAVAMAETVHAHNHFGIMDGVGTTKDNLLAALNGETYEFTKMYPGFIREAEKEGLKRANWSFDMANKVEQIHATLFEQAIREMPRDAAADYFVCSVCGNTVHGEPPDNCPICGALKDKFMRVD